MRTKKLSKLGIGIFKNNLMTKIVYEEVLFSIL